MSLSRCAAGLAVLLACVAPASALAAGARCGELKLSRSVKGIILQQQAVAAGSFQPDATPTLPALPAFCRVIAALHPVSQSDIRIEVWLPQSGWNGKFLGVG